jgi:hypothetical protein
MLPRPLLQHVLDDVVTKGVLHQQQRVVDDVSSQRFPLFLRCGVQTALQHTAPVTVPRHYQALCVDGINDKGTVADRQVLQTTLAATQRTHNSKRQQQTSTANVNHTHTHTVT